MTTEQERWHVFPLRVRYEETDQMRVVFHGNYLTWFEIGRTELIRYAGFAYKEIEAAGLLLPVIDIDCKYVKPARYDDIVLVCTRIVDFTSIRISFESQIRRGSELGLTAGSRLESADALESFELLAAGGTRHMWVNSDFKPTRLERAFPELYDKLAQVVAQSD
ncbi:thioesterase superfamily protein [Paenibacillus curdlanolyticus YK9]|uniref:Thioesterase superfamily protein n=1 Tax=Paenibacillus curdlanolyticus YK9 TaxID=717606 RepID=E0IDL6_9BACL|nr:thioesterase family protein [Paenibacillus curdlanolyticus]EFM09220.1 thioesterase superfamily protein [Paenibacillus curdlanolyticus YK9]